ncbi:MAG: type II toxin-antitoxin system VapC family toxin [Candidatus Kariarchaeaceae archaeon]|jgi:tRNA(fMet)-specific endonuclease VapC
MKYIADTDFLIALFRKKPEALALLGRLKRSDLLYTTTINAAELFHGVYRSQAVSSHLRVTSELLSSFRLLDFGLDHAMQFGQLVARIGFDQMNAMDILVTSIALAEQATVITNNTRHFEPSGVSLLAF